MIIKRIGAIVGFIILSMFFCPSYSYSGDFPRLSGDYLGQKTPGMTPEIFAPGVICLKNRFVQDIAISPDGKEICFVVTNERWKDFKILYTRQDKNSHWTKPINAPFLKKNDPGMRPFFSPDGRSVYYIFPDTRNVRMSTRTKSGWTEPVTLPMPVSSNKMENSVSHSADGHLFFCSHRDGGKGHCDLYYSKITGGKYSPAKNIVGSNTGYNDCGPVISPDGKCMVFHSNRPGGYGGADLYACFKDRKNKWSKPKNLGAKVNTKAYEIIAHFSPDGKYLFFTRRQAVHTTEPSKIYWVSAGLLKR